MLSGQKGMNPAKLGVNIASSENFQEMLDLHYKI